MKDMEERVEGLAEEWVEEWVEEWDHEEEAVGLMNKKSNYS